ncbi:MAG TPA: hypothetical protein VKM93_08285 [Terriglobia bacterium]|nr:hypothetical protein [Terriglobia bacterium]
MIQQWLLAHLLRRAGEGLLNLKDLLIVFPSSGRSTFSGFVGRLKRDEAYLLIPQGLLAKSRRRTGEGLLNLKDLLIVFPSSGRSTFSGLIGRLKRDEAYLLIPQGLLAKLRRRTGESVLNLKDLLTVFSPSLKRLLENDPVLKPLFFVQNRTKLCHFLPKTCR